MLRNFKKRKKFFSIILAFLFSMGSIAPLAEVYAKDYGDLSVIKYDSLREENHTNVLSDIRLKPIHKDNEGNEKTSYLTHEKVTVDVGFSTSNTTGKLDNTKFIITMPAEYIKLETPNDHTDDDGLQLSELQSADAGPDLKLIDENWVITYTYNSVPGGYSGDVPISIRTVMGDTPNGYKLPITVKVTDKNGNILPGGLIEKELTFNTKPPKHRKRVGTGDNILNNYENSVDKFLIGPAKDEEGNVLSGELGQNTVPEKHQPVNFRFDLYEKTRINKGVGARKYEKVVVEDKLPEGAVFIPSENPGWTEATNESGEKILRYEVNYPDGVDFNYNPTLDARSDKSPILDKEGKPVFLKLYFPGVKVRENNEDIIFTNSSTVELTPHKMKLDDKITKVTSDVKFKLETLVPSYKVSKIGPTLDVTDTKRDRKNLKEWSINIGNYTDLNFENLEINDFLGYHKNMNDQESKESVEELNLVKLKIFATDEKIFKGSFDIYAIGRDKSKKEIAKNVSITEEYNVDLPEDTVSVLFIATEGSVFYSQGYGAKDIQANRLNIRLYSVFKESQPKNVLKRERKYNSVKVIADSSKGSLTKYAGDFMYLAPVKREYKIEKSIVDEKGIYHIGNEVQFNLKAWFAHLYPGDKNDVVRIIDLLPEFTEYVKGSTTNTRDNRKILNGKELEPKVVENYMGLGKTALIWEFGPLEHNGDRPILGLLEPIHYNFDLNYKIKVNKGALGDLENAAYLGFEGVPRYPTDKTSSEDIVDTNGNGDTTDKVSKSSVKFTIAPPRELVGTKYVIGSEDITYISSSGHATAEVNGSGIFKYRLHNTNTIDYKQAILVDVLPHIGDYTLSSAATSGYETEYRNSEFEVTLRGPVKFLDPFKDDDVDSNNTANRFDVFYSFERPKSEDKIGEYSFGTEAWKTEAEVGQNWDKVKAIKIQLKEGEIIKGESYDDFYVEFNMPGDQTLTEANQINNSFAFSTYPSVDSLNESNIVKLKPVRYKVSGISWEDKDNNGIYADGEKLLTNTKVRLMKVNEDGSIEVAKDTKGKEYVTTTDKNGHYEFNVYNKGKYFVEMIRPNKHVATKVVEDSDKGNHMTDQNDKESGEYSYSSSKAFDLNKDHKEQIANGGWYRSSIDIKVTKNWELIGDKKPVDKIEVELYRDGVATENKLTLNDENKWSVEFKDLDVAEKPGSTDYEYTVKEIGETEGSIKLSDKWFNVTYEGSMVDGYTITNKEARPWTPMEVPTREVKVSKVFTDFNGDTIDSPVDEIQVQLYKNGEATDKKVTLSADNNWSTIFKKLPAYESLENTTPFNYTVKEVGEEKGSVKLSDKWFNVTYEGSVKEGFTITNKESKPWTPMEVPTRNVKVTKIWELIGNKKPADNIEVELYKDGVATGKKETLNAENNWSISFKKLPVYESLENTKTFEYTVKEVGEENGSIKLEDKWFNVTYEGSMEDGYTITNKESRPWTPMEVPTRNVKVTKTWELIGDKKPADNIEVELYKDGVATGKKETLNAENNWSTSFNKLPVYESLENTKAFEYTVKEVGEEKGSIKLEDKWFKVTYEGSMKDGFKITNKELEKKNPSKKDKMNPNTGDSFNGYLYIGLIILSAVLLLLLEFNKKKKNSNIESVIKSL